MRKIILSKTDIILGHFLSNFCSIFALVGSPSEYKLMEYDSKRIIIRRKAVISSKEYLRCHIDWCTAGLISKLILLIINLMFGNSKISYSSISILFEYYVLGFQIFMDDVHVMDVF